jgi:hypothetical protein
VDPRGPFLVPLLVLILVRLWTWSRIPQGAEDAYITYRYARHFASGNGLVYNPGERVMGFSSPLWTMWNALGYALMHQPLVWSRVTAMIADVVTLITMGGLLARYASRVSAGCFAYFFAMWPYFAAVSMSGMECSLMVALIPLSAVLLARRSMASGLTLAALALTRPEGVASAALLALIASWRARIVALVIAVLGYGTLAAYFGTLVPQSLIAKAMIYGTPGPWAGRSWWDWFMPFPVGRWPRVGDTAMIVPLSVLIAPSAVLGAARLWRERPLPLVAAVAAASIVWIGYALLGVTYFWWYLAVPLAGVATLAAIGFPSLARGPALYIATAMMVCGIWMVASQLYIGRWQEEAGSFGGAADYLRDNARSGEKVMLEPIGMVGYEAPLVVIDEVGLVTPRVARRRAQGPGWYADVAAEERPDWLVLRNGVMRTGEAFAGRGAPFRSAAERDSLFARYRLVAQAEESLGDRSLVILRRFR